MKLENMVGKVSGFDWSKAPEDATHCKVGASHSDYIWYKQGEYWQPTHHCWLHSNDWYNSRLFTFLSKEEDLGLNTQPTSWKCVRDLPIGMFIKWEHETHVQIYLRIKDGAVIVYDNRNSNPSRDYIITKMDECFNPILCSYSYTYNGEYLPLAVETEEDKQIKQLQATIDEAQEAIRLKSKSNL
jgi:hypothetical protein